MPRAQVSTSTLRARRAPTPQPTWSRLPAEMQHGEGGVDSWPQICTGGYPSKACRKPSENQTQLGPRGARHRPPPSPRAQHFPILQCLHRSTYVRVWYRGLVSLNIVSGSVRLRKARRSQEGEQGRGTLRLGWHRDQVENVVDMAAVGILGHHRAIVAPESSLKASR